MFIRTATFCLLTAVLCFPAYALDFAQSANLWEHLQEVNVQWEKQVQDAAPYQYPVQFRNEAERIRTHLSLVEGILRARTSPDLDETQRANRLRHLNELRAYHQAGMFPQNYQHRERTPYFIDVHGTACAVGHLLIEDGHAAFAQRIQQQGNHAYLLDMPYPELPEWAAANGFTLEELAWIQPGYPLSDPSWTQLPAVPNGEVKFIFEDIANGQVVLTGTFSQAGPLPVNNFYTFDGSSIYTYGNGVNGEVKCAARFNGKLYLGGIFNQGANNLMVWDGSAWFFETAFNGEIYAMVEYNGQLAIGGNLTQSGGGQTQHVLLGELWSWTPTGMGFDAPVRALEVHGGQLYAGGDFQNSGAVTTSHVAVYDGTAWQAVHSGLGSPVKTLLSAKGSLYAGGKIYKESQPFIRDFGIARMGANSWENMLDSAYTYSSTGFAEVNRLQYNDEYIYAGGDFQTLTFFHVGNYLGFFDPGSKTISPMVYADQPINAFGFYGRQLVIGGAFANVSPNTASYVAQKTIALGATPPQAQRSFDAFPNPAAQSTRVALRGTDPAGLQEVEAWDLRGKRVALHWQRQGDQVLVQRRTLPAGRYFLRFLGTDQLLGTASVVFQ